MVQVNWTPQAIEDTDEIAEKIAKNSFLYAQIQVQRFFDRAKILETMLVEYFRN